jgi:hypothetical protein
MRTAVRREPHEHNVLFARLRNLPARNDPERIGIQHDLENRRVEGRSTGSIVIKVAVKNRPIDMRIDTAVQGVFESDGPDPGGKRLGNEPDPFSGKKNPPIC